MLIGINGGYFPAICRVCLINFIGVNFEAGNETREKIWSDFVAEQNEKLSEKRVVFCSYRCFSREREIEVWKKFCKRAKFFVHVRLLKAVFSQFFLFKRFGYDLLSILGWVW